MSSAYRDLYHEWERGQWEAAGVDVSVDQSSWSSLGLQERKAVLTVLGRALVAAVRAGEALVVLVDAAPTEEQQVFLTTELVDVSRHSVFFDHWLVEVTGAAGNMGTRVEESADALEVETRGLIETMTRTAGALSVSPRNRTALTDAVRSLRSLVAHTGALAIGARVQSPLSGRAMPGLEEGLRAIERDQERHARFAELLLAELTTAEPAPLP